MSSDYFAQKFREAFPPAPPQPPYQFPVLSRLDSPVMTLKPSQGQTGGGSRVPMAVRVVTSRGLVTTYRFVRALWRRFAETRPVRPPQTLLPHSTLLKPGVSPKGAYKGRRPFDPYGAFNFVLEIGDIKVAFSKFDGVDVEIDQIEYKDSLDTHPHKRPGIHRFGNLKFSKGVVADKSLWEWIHKTMAGDIVRKNGTISILGDDKDKNKSEITYNFYQAWPCKWTGLRLDGSSGSVLVEELELAVDYVARA